MTRYQHPLRHHHFYKHYFRCVYCKKKDIEVVPDKTPGIFLCRYCGGAYSSHTWRFTVLLPCNTKYIVASYGLIVILNTIFVFLTVIFSSYYFLLTGKNYGILERIVALFLAGSFMCVQGPAYVFYTGKEKLTSGSSLYVFEYGLRATVAICSFIFYLVILDFFGLWQVQGS